MSQSQPLVLLVFSGIFGLLIGSFLNVCIHRLPRNCMSLVRPRSRCPKCLRMIAWYDNIPVASWLALGGKCRGCRERISVRYPLVELLTAGLFFYAAWRQIYAPSTLAPQPEQRAVLFAAHAWFLAALLACTFIDLEFRIIPDEITYSGIVIGLAACAVFPFVYTVHAGELPFRISNPHVAALAASALGAVAGGGAVKLVGVLGELVFRKEAMGGGDVKFMAMVGTILGWRGVLYTFVLACLFGSVYGIGKLLVLRRMGYVPFGPFLTAGALFMLFGSKLVNQGIVAYLRFVQRLVQ